MIKMTPELYNKFAIKQEDLDSMIREKHNLSEWQWHYELNMNHAIALQVEKAELANELFDEWKYWKQKAVTPDRIIDEAVDVIHFLHLILNKEVLKDITNPEEQLNKINDGTERWKKFSTKFLIDSLVQYSTSFCEEYAILLVILARYGFTLDDIEQAYDRKNAINHDRQHHNY